jgi:beta-lactamase superfamily II metal-dependent hydrolase
MPRSLSRLRRAARALAALLVLAVAGRGLAAQQLEILFLDVGQGDAVLITSPAGRRVLIDAGASRTLVDRELRRLGVDTLDLVVASHNHADHIGGMEAVLGGGAGGERGSRVVRFYMDNGVPATTATYRRVMAAVQARGIQYLQATARTITLGGAPADGPGGDGAGAGPVVRLRVLPPPGLAGEQNDNSVGLVLEYGTFRALFTGDSEHAELAHWLARDSVPRVMVVKAAHHGSWNGTSAAWAAATRPGVVVVSVGAGNRYGHPAAVALEQWRAVGARIYRTDMDGPVLVTVRPDGVFNVRRQARAAAATEGRN